ncbi:hypothetical protein [Portibacter marinus]|uniref:hypothetical protein n=1 Tax=Portibacter marinus TaxID=2898660 RepID=UPI001F18852E|nr:hypothetical protein [Portibacter marinus]
MAQTKSEKRNQAKKVAEQTAAKKKADRMAKGQTGLASNAKKAKSTIPQTKKK